MMLPAMIENKPKDDNEQVRLGDGIWSGKDPEGALEHLETGKRGKTERQAR